MKFKAREFLFFSAYILYLFLKIFFSDSTYGNLVPSYFKSVLLYASYFIFIIKIISDKKYDKKGLIIIILFTILGIIISYFSDVINILELFLIIYAARNIEFKKIARVTLIEIGLLSLIIIISCKLGIIQNYVFIRKNGSIRNSLGFSYVGKLPVFLMEMEFLYLYLKEKNNKHANVIAIIIMFIINYIAYMLTDVKNCFILSSLMIVLYVICVRKGYIDFKKKSLKVVLCSVYVICLVTSVFLAIHYDSGNPKYVELDEVLTGRLEITHKMIKKYPISLFGNSITMYGSTAIKYKHIKGTDYSYIDSAYIQILLRYGILFSAIFGIAYISLMKKSIEKDKKMLAIWLFLLAISSIIDDTIINIQYNCVLLYLFQSLREKE